MHGIFIKKGAHDLFRLWFQNKSLPSAEGFDSAVGKVSLREQHSAGFDNLKGGGGQVRIKKDSLIGT